MSLQARRALLALLLIGCGEPASRTQIVVWVDADSAVRAGTAVLDVNLRSSSDDQTPFRQRVLRPSWPLKLVLAPAAEDATRRYELRAEAFDAQSRAIAGLTLQSGFVAGQARFVKLVLAAGCVGSAALVQRSASHFGRTAASALSLRACAAATEPGDGGMNGGDEPVADGGDRDSSMLGSQEPAAMSCSAGYRQVGDRCLDLDECAEAGRCGEHARCENTPGSFSCRCEDGFEMRDGVCAKQSPCARDNGGCEHECIALADYHRCACPAGTWAKPNVNLCWEWHERVKLELRDGDVGDAVLAMNSNGVAVAAWVERGITSYDVWVNRYTLATQWQAAIKLTTRESSWVGAPALAVDDAGNAVVLWEENWEGAAHPFGALLPFETWGARTDIGSGFPAGASSLTLLAGPGGAFVAGWAATNAASTATATNVFWLRRFSRAAGWGDPIALGSSPSADLGSPFAFAVDPTGAITAIWLQAGPSLWAAKLAPESNVASTPVRIDGAVAGSALGDFQLAVNHLGNALAVWSQRDPGAATDSLYSSRLGYSDWEPSELVAPNLVTGGRSPRVVFDGADRANLFWLQRESAQVRVWFKQSNSWSIWGEAAPLAATRNVDPYSLDIAADALGNVFAVWSELDGSRGDVVADRFASSIGWTGEQRLEADDTGAALAPRVATDGGGNAVVLWTQSNGSRVDLWARSFE